MNEVKIKNEKGITLIALSVTIIILLILSGIAIATLTGNNGVIEKSGETKASAEHESAKEKLQADVLSCKKKNGKIDVNELNKRFEKLGIESITEFPATIIFGNETYILDEEGNLSVKAAWEENEDGSFSDGSVTAKIGDRVEYNEAKFKDYTTDITKGICGSAAYQTNSEGKHTPKAKTYTTEDLKWRILGINEKGQIELISENAIAESVCLANEEGYLYGPEELNNMCNTLYGNGTNTSGEKVAESARSLNVEDLMTLAKCSPTSNKDYKSLWQYQFPENGTYMQYRKSNDNGTTWTEWTDITDSNYQTFKMPGASDSEKISKENPGSITVTNTFYSFSSMTSKITQMTEDNIKFGSIIGSGLNLNGEINGSPANQWLASNFVYCNSDRAHFYIFFLNWGNMGIRYPNDYDIYHSNGHNWYMSFRVRPVVTLNSNVTLEKDSNGIWQIKLKTL